eukprot:439283-Amorphochlora_amoeboformis.AAC.2
MADSKDGGSLDSKVVQEYLCSVAYPLLRTDKGTLQAVLQANATKIQEFITEGHTRRLMIRRNLDIDGKETIFSVVTEVQTYGSRKDSQGISVLFIKSFPQLQEGRPLPQQIYACQVKDTAPYEAMLNFVRHAFLPYSRSIMATDKEDSKQVMDFNALRNVHSKLSELEVSLLRCQQNVEIPQIQLQVHPLIQSIMQKIKGRKPTLDDLPNDPDFDMDKFLNELTNILKDWKKLIASVTKLDRDISTGSTKEEIHFWGSMERTLNKIDRQLKNPGVQFTFDVLNAHQRFLATTGFHDECNLTGCTRMVKKYNDLLRDFPIRNLIEAVSINDLKDSIGQIFKHLKHIGRIKYPLDRALALVHTISRDIALQLRSILNAKRLMMLAFDDFDAATRDSKSLFRKWDTQHDVFQDDIRTLHHREQRKLEFSQTYTAMMAIRKRIAEIRQLRKDHFQLIE